MNSLQVQSALMLVKGKTLPETMAFFEANRDGLIGMLADSPAFWRALVLKFYGASFVEQRQDIPERDYRLWAEALADGKTFVYGVAVNLNLFPERKLRGPLLMESRDAEEDLLVEPAQEFPLFFSLLGLQPLEGSKGYVGDFSSQVTLLIDWDEEASYFLTGPAGDLATLAQEFKLYLARKAYEALRHLAAPEERVSFPHLNNELVDFSQDDPAHAELFSAAFLRQPLNPDPNILTELFVCLESNPDIHVQVWVAQISF